MDIFIISLIGHADIVSTIIEEIGQNKAQTNIHMLLNHVIK